jgi:predicted aminopeptidase
MLTETVPRGAARGTARRRRAVLITALSALSALLSGCGTPYLMQAASGEWHVMHARVPIERVVADPHTPPQLRTRLELVRAARQFASAELGLPDNKSYRTYADIGRPYVVWNVVATPEFSVVPHHWCFPVAGCVAYRGYFHEASAAKFAAGLAAQGYDVAIDGVPAYSTLGTFADPVLSSMMRYGDDELAATIFHELAHQLLYVKDDSAFNEAFATTVEDAGLERWLAHQGSPARIQQFRADEVREAAFVKLLAGARAHLATLYASGLAPEAMRPQKAAILAALGVDLRAFGQREGVSYPLYDEWLRQGLNNARLASVATYYDCVPGFKRLLAQEDNDLPRFYAAARKLAHLARAERHARLCGSAAAAADAEAD